MADVQQLEELSRTLEDNAAKITPLSGGKNNRLFKVELSTGEQMVAKFYFSHPSDPRNRLEVDYSAHTFLWNNGVREIAAPRFRSNRQSFALYDYIQGSSVRPFSRDDIDQVVNFVQRLKSLTSLQSAANLPHAAEASFSVVDLVANIERRLEKLSAVERRDDQIHKEFGLFLDQQLIPEFEKQLSSIRALKVKEFFKEPLAQSHRTLSPSDFGFHNAIERADGTWIFHDFEYFGWDDPAKLLCDFVLHPGMDISLELKAYFLRRALKVFSSDPNVVQRFEVLLPLYTIKWCIIILNEFVPEFRMRRGFALEETEERLNQILSTQLGKAKRLLSSIVELMKPLTSGSIPEQQIGLATKLDERSLELRRKVVRTIEAGQRGHVGSSFSLIEILRVLYDDILKFDAKNPRWSERDRCILSKGHGCLALYVVLQDKGFFPEEELWKFCHRDGILGGHPEAGKIPGVEASTGSLGHGLSIGVGMALTAKRENAKHRVYVVISDGECNEGSVWEAGLSAAKHKLNNLTVLVDYNKQQSYGSTAEVLELESLSAKWRAFNFAVEEVDGHDVEAIREAVKRTPFTGDKPSMIICHTVKGKGVPVAENNPAWHHKSKISADEISMMLNALRLP